MASASSRRGRKRKAAADVSLSEPVSIFQNSIFQSPSVLLLGIPAGIDNDLPVWNAIMSQQVNIDWRVNPYGVSVHFTPQRDQMILRKRESNPAPPSDGQLYQAAVQSPNPQHSISITASHVLLTTSTTTKSQALTPDTPMLCNILPLPLVINPPSISPKKQACPRTQPPPADASLPLPPSKAPVPLSFHTQNPHNIKICDPFLLGRCGLGSKCELNHTPLPFHWQLWCVTTYQWVDIPPRSQILLERLYCDVSQKAIDLKDGQSSYHLNFEKLQLHAPSKYDGVRRLTNTDDTDVNPYFPSKWQMYWWYNVSWEAYREDLSELLVKKKNEKESECFFSIGSQKYKVTFISMIQTNISTGFQRKIQCRPIYRSLASMEPQLKTGILTEATQPPSKPFRDNFDVDPLEEFNSWYPPMWSLASKQDYSLMEVPKGTQAYRSVQTIFHKSLSETKVDIVSIQLVQNFLHWDNYQRYKVHMQTRHSAFKEPLEKHLFHGTTKEAAEDICHNNFDPRMSGVNGVSFGHGSYFATSAIFSNIFSCKDEIRHMFLAKVLVGKVTVGEANYRRPPPLTSKRKKQCRHCLYDTCVDKVENPTMFVVFDSCQCYPYYLIKYKELPKEVYIEE
ncbi:protein mono-ADP-ribosyltransferase TIPARP-like [Genypterus blacodes]|uniref:protein mono-ADP-ribosyltransferase TIPARP-like n=1 Tax=Genypterus blacodes TaxID=154954 RepID=UPI003F773AD9